MIPTPDTVSRPRPVGAEDPGAAAAVTDCDTSLLDLSALADGALSNEGLERLAAHVATCPACDAVLQAIIDDGRDPHARPPRLRGDWIPLLPPER